MASSSASDDGSESEQNDLRLRKPTREVSTCLCETFLCSPQKIDHFAASS